jgi:hypothetical protein
MLNLLYNEAFKENNMPFIETKTSVKLDESKINALKEAYGKDIEIIPGKTESWLMLNFVGDCKMAFRGKTEPDTAILEVSILGTATKDAYDKLTYKLCEDVSAILGVPSDRIYIKYSEHTVWGYDKENF